MLLIDTHTHLYVEEFNEDRDAVVHRAIASGITKMFLPAIDAATYSAMMDMEKKYPGNCISMMGLHPCSVNESVNNALQIVEEWLNKRPFAAVGEIGLDFYWDKTFMRQQYQAFDLQMQWALEKKLPIVIHTRNAMQETINRVKPFAQKGLTGIFHCFSGSYESAKQIIDMDFMLGIGGVLTYKNAGLPAALEKIPVEHMVLETDAPYLTPVPFRGKRNESSYLQYIATYLATIKSLTLEDLAAITTANAEKIFHV
ncbi:MAG: TatD family hydrolase [Bacteroidota bacterium]